MRQIYYVNEFNLITMLIRGLMGGRAYIADHAPYLFAMRRPLGAITAVLVRAGIVHRVEKLFDGQKLLLDLPIPGPYNDIFPTVEAEAKRSIVGRRITPALDPYRYAVTKIVSHHINELARVLVIAQALEREFGDDGWRMVGVRDDVPSICRWYYGSEPRFNFAKRPNLSRIVNTVVAPVMALAALYLVIARTRPRIRRESYLLAADAWALYDHELFDQAVGRGDILIIYRNRAHELRDRERFAGYSTCGRGDGRLTPRHAANLIAMAFRDCFRLWRAFGDCDTEVYFKTMCLVAKRCLFAALFERFDAKFLWARDDYSIDHVIRNQEFRKLGGTSIGINHGLPIATYAAAWREIDFDIYYTFGRHLYETYYKDVWSPGMEVKPIGPHHLTEERRRRLNGATTSDIVLFINPSFHNREIVAELATVARRFPDRKILVQIKPSRSDDGSCDEVREAMRDVPSNMVETGDETFELLLRVSYAVSSGSTLGAESLPFKVKSFVFDLCDEITHFYYRDFPDMCVRSGEELCRRIEDIEAGRSDYPLDRLTELIEMSGPTVLDQLRSDIGMPQVVRKTDAE